MSEITFLLVTISNIANNNILAILILLDWAVICTMVQTVHDKFLLLTFDEC